MSNETLLIDSTYRNRRNFPNPFRFEIKVKNNLMFDKKTVGDAISDQAPIESWTPNELLLSGTVVKCMSHSVFIVKIAQEIEYNINYYRSLKLRYRSSVTSGLFIENTIIGTKFELETVCKKTS